MIRHQFQIDLTLRGPILAKSTSPSHFGFDAAFARVEFGKHSGSPCIPATHIKGKIREAMEELGQDPGELLGRSFEEEFTAGRGSLSIGDFVAVDAPETALAPRHQIQVDRELGSARGKMLRILEAPFESGKEITFRGEIFFFGSKSEAESVQSTLDKAIRWIPQIGSNRTVGFGRVLCASVERVDPHRSTISIKDKAVAIQFALRPISPLCITAPKRGSENGGNLFESETIIPGNMIAGALHQTSLQSNSNHSELTQYFDQLVFKHAFPTRVLEDAQRVERPEALPLSLAEADENIYDLWLCDEPCSLHDQAPSFSVDWKRDTSYQTMQRYGWADPARELRVRTKIDSDLRTADRGQESEGGQLFSMELVHPVDPEEKPIAWIGEIHFHKIKDDSERRKAIESTQELLDQLGFVSKTKAVCAVEHYKLGTVRKVDLPETRNLLALTLQTPCLLGDPRFQKSDDNNDLPTWETCYRDAWNELSGSSLRLNHFFAAQSLVGGKYLANRFRNDNPYRPWILTDPGSVFVFNVIDREAAKTCIQEWLHSGLGLPEWAQLEFGSSWNENPYIPQNGFGEVKIHQPKYPDVVPAL